MAQPTNKVGPQFSRNSKLGRARAREFEVIRSFEHGYRNREDKTNLPSNTLITGSQNVLTDVSGRVGSRKGYTLDGAASSTLAGILSAYDYNVAAGFIRNLRGGFLTSALNDGKLQYRYDNGTTVTWRDLLTGLTSVAFNFTRWWSSTLNQSLCLMVNGAGSITEWTGGITVIASVTANTMTNAGTSTWAQAGFYSTGNHSVTVNGVDYAYTGGHGTHTLTGVSPSPLAAVVAGDIAHQTPETTTNGTMSLALTTNDLISQLNNHVYVGSFTNQVVYISKDSDYKNFTFTSPVRTVGEGAILTLNATPKALITQENQMYLSSGLSDWGLVQFTLSADNSAEAVSYQELNTVPLQGAQSQALTGKIRNNVFFLSNEPILTTWGRVDNVFPTPQTTDLSSSIVNDVSELDFTGGSVFWHKNFVYVTAPAESITLIYNMTNPKNNYWEAPQILPISLFYVVDGELYGHSYNSSESYKMFDGYNDNGNFIESVAKFAYNNHGSRFLNKSFGEFYAEGYISSNTTLAFGYEFDLDGCATSTSRDLDGSDQQVVCISTDDNVLGHFPLGKNPLGGNASQVTNQTLPPKFRVVKTSNRVPYFEYSPSFRSNGLDQQWSIIAFGPAASPTAEGQPSITE